MAKRYRVSYYRPLYIYISGAQSLLGNAKSEKYLSFIVVCPVFQKMVNGGIVNTWICVNFARNVQESAARGFCHELAQMCMVSGMVGVLNASMIC